MSWMQCVQALVAVFSATGCEQECLEELREGRECRDVLSSQCTSTTLPACPSSSNSTVAPPPGSSALCLLAWLCIECVRALLMQHA